MEMDLAAELRQMAAQSGTLRAEAGGAGRSRSIFWSRPDGRLHVQWFRASGEVSFDTHTHPEFNIVVSLAGAVRTAQLGMAETIERGACMMGSNPGVPHASCYLPEPQGCQAVGLTFSPDVLDETFGGRGFLPVREGYQRAFIGKVHSPAILAAAEDVRTELMQQAPAYEVVLEGLAKRILIECIRIWPRQSVEEVREEPQPLLSRRDHVRASEFMQWCKKDDFRLQHLCRFLGTSEERFTRLFRASTGDSPAAFYNRFLLDRAAELLTGTAAAVKEVSYELGFKTPSHFVVAFRRQFGCTPMEYRGGMGPLSASARHARQPDTK
jgi:AraC-like DNA-binding protein